ncbi:hypothetical protein BC835DRAFT_690706 [Cytidiella melzeri]|nr:hypothetical protein BC835DRAFT_690706 [Cytidiella melzeri]
MATIHDSPHPLLTDPILYLADPPKRIKWYHLEEVFRPCGAISSGGKSTVYGKSNRKRWTVRFSSVYLAEMALATLQGATVTGPNLLPWTMVISHSCTLEAAFPSHRIFPQFVRTDLNGTPGHIGAEEDPQTLFKWFRRAGPLVSVQTDVNVGYPQRAIVVEYWNEEHANLARIKKNALHEDMQHRPAFTLRTYDPHNLYCAGFGATFTHKDFVGAFSEFGPINQ